MIDINKDVYKTMFNNTSITLVDIAEYNIKYIPEEQRVYFPVLDFYGRVSGGIAKAITKDIKPKWMTYKQTDKDFISYYIQPNETTVVLVEDVISAIHVNKITSAIALLGTSLKKDCLTNLIALDPKKIFISLDPGAMDAAYKIEKQLKAYFPSVSVVIFDKDPKYIPLEELEKFYATK